MEEKDFLLGSRFEIRPATHLVVDTELKKQVRVEPRLIKLLCLLAAHPGQLVSREFLVAEIWKDYGGGEAGLNHAISSLRKILDDTSRNLIETIPTKGYILHARVSEISSQLAEKTTAPKKNTKRLVLYTLLIIAAGVLGYAITASSNKKRELSKDNIQVPFDQVNQKPAETPLNTVVSIGPDHTEYKLKMIGDSPPEFFINGRLLSPDEMEQHRDLINNLKKTLTARKEGL